MRADTQTISIAAPASKVFDFLREPQNLPRWAMGFAKSVRQGSDEAASSQNEATDDMGFAKSVRQGSDGWYVTTAQGEIAVSIDADRRTGVVDFRMRPAPEIEVVAASRVIPRGGDTEYTFTQFQVAGMPDEVFSQSIQALRHELAVLKAMAEVECPF